MEQKTFRWKQFDISFFDVGTGVPVVLVHAFPLNARMWAPQLKELQKELRIIAMDLPGFGNSDPIPDVLTMELGADIVNAVLEHLRIETATIGGLSMGGYVTMAFARKYPGKMERIILANTRATADTDEGRQKREEVAQQVLKEGTTGFVEHMLTLLVGKSTRTKNPETVDFVRQIMLEATPKAIAAAQRGMARRPDSFDVLGNLEVPALIIAGEEDTVTPKSDAEAMLSAMKQATLFTIKKAGHLTNIEAPAQFNLALSSFLTEND